VKSTYLVANREVNLPSCKSWSQQWRSIVDFPMLLSRTVRYTDIPKISVLNQYRYIVTGYSTIPIYRNFGYTGIFRYTVLNLPTIWRNHNLYFTTEWQFKELSTVQWFRISTSVRFYTEYVHVVRNMFETASKLSFSLLELLKISFKLPLKNFPL
jgi:hypothetical protein